MTHSKIGASSMHRWANCPASVRLSVGLTPIESKYAKEGTVAHEFAAQWLESGKREAPIALQNKEMLDAIKVYVEEVYSDYGSIHANYENIFLVEHKFDLSVIHPGLFGTSDCVTFDAKKKLLRVYDYKHGAGIGVDVVANEQLMYYGLGALISTNLPALEVELVIVQPRCPHPDGIVRRWKFDAIDLLDFQADLKASAIKTEDPNAAIVPGDWCRFCPAAATCPELYKKALSVAENQFSPAEVYDPIKLATTLKLLPTLEAFATQVREFAYAEAMRGRVVPGFKLVAKRAMRRWKDEAEIEKYIKSEHSVFATDCFTTPTVKSVAQVEKILGKKDKGKLSEFVLAESSGNKLVEESEPGEPIKLDGANVFNDVESLLL